MSSHFLCCRSWSAKGGKITCKIIWPTPCYIRCCLRALCASKNLIFMLNNWSIDAFVTHRSAIIMSCGHVYTTSMGRTKHPLYTSLYWMFWWYNVRQVLLLEGWTHGDPGPRAAGIPETGRTHRCDAQMRPFLCTEALTWNTAFLFQLCLLFTHMKIFSVAKGNIKKSIYF